MAAAALGFETADHASRVHTEFDYLEGDATANGLLLLGHVNHAATAFAKLLEKFVAADFVAGFFGDRKGVGNGFCFFGCGGRVEKGTGFFVGVEHDFDLVAESGFVSASLVNVSSALLQRQLERAVEDGLAAFGQRFCQI